MNVETDNTNSDKRRKFLRQRWLWGIAVFGLLLWSIKAIHHGLQPKYQGKTAQEWYEQFNPYRDSSTLTELSGSSTDASFRAFQHFGPEAAQFLWGEYTHKDSALKTWCIQKAHAWSAGRWRIDSDYVRGFKASFLLRAMGPKADCLLPELHARLKSAASDYERKAMLDLLNEIGPKDLSKLPYLIAGLNSSNTARQFESLDALQELGIPASPALPTLENLLQKSKGFDRLRIATTMIALGDKSKLRLLQDEIMAPNARLQDHAFVLLASLTKDRVDVLPTLTAIAEDSRTTQMTKKTAISLIEQISPGTTRTAGSKP